MARRVITGTFTYANQSNRDAARTRLDSAVSGYTYWSIATVFSSGINNNGTTGITVSIYCDEADAVAYSTAIYNAITSSNRNTSGYISVNKI